jgi:hypothetical protein
MIRANPCRKLNLRRHLSMEEASGPSDLGIASWMSEQESEMSYSIKGYSKANTGKVSTVGRSSKRVIEISVNKGKRR